MLKIAAPVHIVAKKQKNKTKQKLQYHFSSPEPQAQDNLL